ncbi:MAG: biotin transporter BioY [Coriobacteriaceae bacterium]|nr:biotin transporter BioY [Coriobacteriaceae bacterium]
MIADRTDSRLSSRTQTAVFCGLTIALMTVSAWITIPIGVVPVTLQVFVLVFALLFLTPRQYLLSLVVYLLLGTIGLPVFSAMRGGLGVIAGPTGGFLWGFLAGAVGALVLLRVVGARRGRVAGTRGFRDTQPVRYLSGRRGFALSVTAALVFMAFMYLFGWLQLVFVTGMAPSAAFAVGVAPFIVIDIVKTIAAVLTAQAVARALK